MAPNTAKTIAKPSFQEAARDITQTETNKPVAQKRLTTKDFRLGNIVYALIF